MNNFIKEYNTSKNASFWTTSFCEHFYSLPKFVSGTTVGLVLLVNYFFQFSDIGIIHLDKSK